MKKLLVFILVLGMASLAGATTVSFVAEGTSIITGPGVVRLEVTSDAGLYYLDAVATVLGAHVITAATNLGDCATYGWDPGLSFEPIGIGTAVAEIGLGTFGAPPSGVVAYFDVLYTGGEIVVSIANGMTFGGSGDTNFLTPEFSDGVVTIFPFSPTCWYTSECAGQPRGDATCDGSINLADLLALKAAWGKAAPWTPPFCCADFNHDGSVNLGDLLILKTDWNTCCLLPGTGNQDCPEEIR